MSDEQKKSIIATIDQINDLTKILRSTINTEKLLDGDRTMNRLATIVKRSNRFKKLLDRSINPTKKKIASK